MTNEQIQQNSINLVQNVPHKLKMFPKQRLRCLRLLETPPWACGYKGPCPTGRVKAARRQHRTSLHTWEVTPGSKLLKIPQNGSPM